MEENEEILSEEETMHEYNDWQEDYAEMQAEWYADNM